MPPDLVMAKEIKIPRLGWNMDEGDFVEWLRADGERIEAGQPLFSIESDKAIAEVEALDSGILRIPPDGPRKGQTLPVGAVIGYLCAEGEEEPWTGRAVAADTLQRRTASAETLPADLQSQSQPVTRLGQPARCISPRAARLAAELGVDWTGVTGTGRTGRVRERDIRRAAQQT